MIKKISILIKQRNITTHNIPPYSVYYPEATTCKKKRFSDEDIAVHEKMLNEKKGVIL